MCEKHSLPLQPRQRITDSAKPGLGQRLAGMSLQFSTKKVLHQQIPPSLDTTYQPQLIHFTRIWTQWAAMAAGSLRLWSTPFISLQLSH